MDSNQGHLKYETVLLHACEIDLEWNVEQNAWSEDGKRICIWWQILVTSIRFVFFIWFYDCNETNGDEMGAAYSKYKMGQK